MSKKVSPNKSKIVKKGSNSTTNKERKLKNKQKTDTKEEVVATEDDKRVHEKVKRKTSKRKANYEYELPSRMEDVDNFFNGVDAYVEYIDDRDRENDRGLECDKFIIHKERKPYFVYRSHKIEGISYQGLENTIELTNANQLISFEKICLFGQGWMGYIGFSEEIEKHIPSRKAIIRIGFKSNRQLWMKFYQKNKPPFT